MSDVVSPPVTLFMGADKHESKYRRTTDFVCLQNNISNTLVLIVIKFNFLYRRRLDKMGMARGCLVSRR